ALVESGQLIRRESSFEGVIINDKYTNDILKNDEIRINQNWDIYSEIMQAILQFDKLVKPIVLGYIKAGEMQSDEFSKVGNVDSLKVEQSNFSSRLHNLIALLDLSLKAKATVEYVTQLIDKGEKVIIVLSNTAGSLINSEYPVGTKADTTLKAIFKKSLYSTLSYTVTKWKNPAVKHTISVEMLKESFPQVYQFFSAIENLIDNIKTDDPLSTIDYITYHLEKRNISVMEITGRNTFIDYNNKFINTNRKKERTESISQKFNNSTEHNCIILNSSGSTGISLHASEKFKDKRKRHMVLIQPSLDINVVMQSLGRIHRTGQVVLPEYTFLNLPIPVAYRLQIVLRKKLSSLNANTKGSSGKNEGTLKKVEDMANFIGDQCVFQYLLANPEINTLLDDPLKLNSDSPTTYKAFLKTSGRLAILKIEEQEEFYDKIFDDYKGKLADYEAQGISLDNQPIDLQAKTISKNTMFPGDPEGKILQRPAIVETVQVKTEKIDIKSEYQKLNIGSEQDIIKKSNGLLDSYRFRKEEARKAKNERRQTKNN
ncbi:MAG: strawberry notch C-terminal domain-containing protein, partial [Leptospiraceae bacterium]|nr:strawberry notch C-terminal domain-containing protein [Leptospiraceae bacterium]